MIFGDRHILNYDFPRHAEEYVHRVGRTGRAGRTGIAISFFTREDWSKAADLTKILEEASQVNPFLSNYFILRTQNYLFTMKFRKYQKNFTKCRSDSVPGKSVKITNVTEMSWTLGASEEVAEEVMEVVLEVVLEVVVEVVETVVEEDSVTTFSRTIPFLCY